ncbi:MAG: outer rane efflux protein [Bryobacterales bacterium]|nr:outer rane efflux protein [Bryobacterales bacterium]
MRRAVVCFFLFVTVMQGQQPLLLTLDEAHRLAITNNPRLSVAQLNAAAAAQIPLELHAAAEPTLTGAITAVGADSGSRLAAGGLNNPAVYNRLASGLTIGQLITDFGRTRSLVDSARFRAQAQDQVTTATRAQILLAVDQAYFAALRAEAVLKVAEQTVAARQIVADQTAALARSNLKSTLDVSFANVNLADAKLLLAASRSNLQARYADLGAALGLPAQFGQGGFSLTPEPMPAALSQPLDELVRQALRDRPELASLRLEQSAAERFSQAEKDLSLPTVALAGAAGLAPVSDPQIQNRYGAVGVNVNIPIFNGHLYRARQAEAQLRVRSASRSVDDLANRIARDVRVAWLNTGNAFERLALTAQLIDQARLALDLAQRRYDIGLTSIVELSQAQLNVTAAEIAGSGAQFDYQLQRANLEYQTGALR